MTNGRRTNNEVFDEIRELRKDVTHRFELVEKQVDVNTDFRNQLIGKMAVMMGLIGIGINIAWDKLFNR